MNTHIRQNEPVETRIMTPDDARAIGAQALFGEKYGDEVRVLSMGRKPDGGRNFSVELCGGTHVEAAGDIGLFHIVSDSAVSSGVQRIEALTGDAARRWLLARDEAVKAIASALNAPDDAAARVAALVDERGGSKRNWPKPSALLRWVEAARPARRRPRTRMLAG